MLLWGVELGLLWLGGVICGMVAVVMIVIVVGLWAMAIGAILSTNIITLVPCGLEGGLESCWGTFFGCWG